MLKAIILGFIQGITEFLPISSSGHLIIVHHWLKYQPSLAMDIVAHGGTMVVILIFFRQDLFGLAKAIFGRGSQKSIQDNRRLLIDLVVASLPVALVGWLWGDKIETIFSQPRFLAIGFWLSAILLILGRFCRYPVKKGRAFLIGLFEALAIAPGISRSGATINGALILGENREKAFRFSFLLGLIAISGAIIFQFPDIYRLVGENPLELGLVFGSAFFSGWLSIKFLHRLFFRDQMWYLAFYCCLIGLVTFWGL